MIEIYIPNSCCNEWRYILKVVFDEMLGVKYKVLFSNDLSDKIILKIGNKIIYFPVILIRDDHFLQTTSLPVMPLLHINPKNVFDYYKGEDDLPVLYGNCSINDWIEIKHNEIHCRVDIFSSIFFMLTRYEEYILHSRDSYGRFIAKDSIAYKEKILTRPIVNEYIELLWSMMKYLAPQLERKKRIFKCIPTHDIDKPFGMMYDSFFQILRHFAGDLLRKKSLVSAIIRIKNLCNIVFYRTQYINEKKETFNYIFMESEKYSLKDYFFFMNSKSSWMDGNYRVNYPDVLDLIKDIYNKGHYIGLHPSFISYCDNKEISEETIHMNKVLSENGLPNIVGARQHYLKWDNPITWKLYAESNIPFDTTLSFVDHVGFRCGTCHPYHVYDLVNRCELNLIERPLIVMEGTLFEYMKLTYDEAMKICLNLANKCKKYNGEFIILWHNTTLDNKEERKFYSELLYNVNEGCK